MVLANLVQLVIDCLEFVAHAIILFFDLPELSPELFPDLEDVILELGSPPALSLALMLVVHKLVFGLVVHLFYANEVHGVRGLAQKLTLCNHVRHFVDLLKQLVVLQLLFYLHQQRMRDRNV